MTKILKIKVLTSDLPDDLELQVNNYLVSLHLRTEDFISIAHSCTTEREAQQGQPNGIIHYTAIIVYREEV